MEKYELLPQQLLYEGTMEKSNFFEPKALSEEEIIKTHDANYWQKLKTLQLNKTEERKTGFPLSAQLVEREITIAGGSLQAAKYALNDGVAFNIAGGTHHAFTSRGEGFCLLNDIAISANHLLNSKLIQQILVVDLDVHQGNGTAEIFNKNKKVFTFSMHGVNNYPFKKEKSDLDIALPDGTEDSLYLRLLRSNLEILLDEVEPDFVFFQAGVDVLKTDKLGKLSLSIEACKSRDSIVFQACLNDNIPVMVSMGGGYSPKISNIVEAHANTYRVAKQLY
ncbi:UNVERIFIED_CONTAM: hypothetical protein GTU68_042102 [Idotea baltica]|nr:hypothetical protein [Idotea baltica]